MNTTRNILILACVVVAAYATSNVRADFIFGELANLKTVIPVIDPALEGIDCFSHDGLEVYLTSDRPGGQGQADLWVLKRSSTEAEWGPPENLGPVVNSTDGEWCASISVDGLTLYFTSNRSGGHGGAADIWMTTRASRDDPWGQPVNMDPKINTTAGDGGAWLSPDGLELYFDSWRPGGSGLADIYVARRPTTGDTWGEPTNLGPVVNSPYYEEFLSLSPDGLLLLFSDLQRQAPRPGGFGGADMWMTRRASLSAPWGPPVNLGANVNGPDVDMQPRISPDGSMLYYYTESGGTWENWQAPILPVVDFNADEDVDLADLVLLIDNWGTADTLYDIGPFAWGDGVVDVLDLTIFIAEWEKVNPPTQP